MKKRNSFFEKSVGAVLAGWGSGLDFFIRVYYDDRRKQFDFMGCCVVCCDHTVKGDHSDDNTILTVGNVTNVVDEGEGL